MKDFRDNELDIGDEIVYKKSGLTRTRDIMFVGEIVDFTPKMIKVKRTYTSEPRAFSLGDIEIVSPNNVCKLNSEQENDATLADNMFEELGYEKHSSKSNERFDLYSSDYKHLIKIVFNLRTKRITIHCDNDALDTQELQAVNKKCQELGWI